jgi:hypothetical protein
MVVRLTLITLLLTVSGCATMERHPYATAFGMAFVAGSIAASSQHDNRVSHTDPIASPSMARIGTPNCAGGSCQ